VLKLIDRGAAPVADGKILLDQKSEFTEAGGDAWLKAAAEWMASHGFGDRVVLETTGRALTNEKSVLGYYSWGSNDPAITSRTLGFGFVPGAIAGMFVSSDARTLNEPPAGWTTGTWTDKSKYFANSPQSLSGDLIREGVTGIAGHVAEPFLDGTIRPDVLFPAYLSGLNLAESFYLAMPYVSWQTVVIGDPLCAPLPRKALQASDIDKGIDPATELPALFSARRMQAATTKGAKPEAVQRLLRYEARTGRGDKTGAVKALEEATAIDPRFAAAHLLLAQAYEETKDYDKAIDRYRSVLAVDANDTVALNNLAYGLAVRKGQPAEAIGYAERALTLTRGSATVADTLAWVQHLLGRDREAAQLLTAAVRAMPANAEVRLHAAVVYAALGLLEPATKELAEALRLDPALEKTDEVKALRGKLVKK
jgi:Tfp pilus assembly protein PilF